MKFFAPKRIVLTRAEIHVHYANNAGRANNNVTLTVVKPGTPRAEYTRAYDEKRIVTQWETTGWRGHVNIPNTQLNKYAPIKRVED